MKKEESVVNKQSSEDREREREREENVLQTSALTPAAVPIAR